MAIYQKDNRQVELKTDVDIQRYKSLGFNEVNEKGKYLEKPVKDDKKKIAELEKENKEIKVTLASANTKISALENENKELKEALASEKKKIAELEKAASEKVGG